jgi:hypothetical protein
MDASRRAGAASGGPAAFGPAFAAPRGRGQRPLGRRAGADLDTIALVAGALLPWGVGLAALCALRAPGRPLAAPGEIAWLAGAGYLVGAFVLTLWMRALSLAGVRFGVTAIALPLAIAGTALAWVAWRRYGRSLVDAPRAALRALVAPPEVAGATRLVWWLLLALLALRFVLLGLDVARQPLYPWDAWMQWATKARVWYELGWIVPFVGSGPWLAGSGTAYFDAAPGYPPTVPLLQTWSCLVLGRWDDALMNWPWWQIAVALSLAVFGGLRSLLVTAPAALFGTFFVASLPLANVHVALAGYADFPLAAYYTAAVLAFLRWHDRRDLPDAGLALLLAIACTQIKNPGIFWALTLVPGVAVALAPRHAVRFAAVGFGGALLALAVLAQTSTTIFNYRLHLEFDPVWAALGESLFLLGNWHLLWYAVLAIAVIARREIVAPALLPLTFVIACGTLFLFVALSFTNARAWVTDQSTVNRATLHFAPLLVVFVMLAFRAFAERWSAPHPGSAIPPAETRTPAA